MAIEKTVIDNERVITPKVITSSLKVGNTVINQIRQTLTDEEDSIPCGSALQPWLDSVLISVENRLTEFEENTIFTYTHPATHSASMITETAARVWFTPDERIKLDEIAENANHYVHDEYHSANMITQTLEFLWMTPEERLKLLGIAPEANHYIHDATHPLSILSNFLDVNGFIRPELIEALNVQRINTRQSILSGFTWNYAGVDTIDYTNAPLLESNVVIGTNEYIIRITPSFINPLVATIANGFNPEIGNVDSVIRVTTPIQTQALSTYGFAPETEVWVVLKSDGTLDVVSTKSIFDSMTMKNSIPGIIPIVRATVSAANNYFTDIVLLQAGRHLFYETGYIPYNTNIVTIPNRLFTDKLVCQVYMQKQGETDWTILDSSASDDYNYNVKLRVNDHHLSLITTNYITQLMTQARFRVCAIRIY